MLFLSVLIVVLLFSGVIVYLSACKTFARVGVSVVSHSAVSTLSLTLQAMLLITVQALHLRELSIIVACINYVKELFCEGALLLLILYTAKIQQNTNTPNFLILLL